MIGRSKVSCPFTGVVSGKNNSYGVGEAWVLGQNKIYMRAGETGVVLGKNNSYKRAGETGVESGKNNSYRAGGTEVVLGKNNCYRRAGKIVGQGWRQ